MALERIHINYLKEYINQLILNQGVINIKNPELVVDKIKVDFLVKLAFRFYSKLYSSEKYASYLKETENPQFEDCEKEYQPILQSMLNVMYLRKQEAVVQCLNCGADIAIKSMSGDRMPICDNCQEDIGMEMDVWEKIFG
ncbi:MAG: hypothetical protein FWG20_02285 [Candidatus Cloacimonetes bacterium]|nr:hypothetical protein [Candidatus Cloacimonadota bacterium]